MTEQELLEAGAQKEECKIGTLYFFYPFFIDLKENEKVGYVYEMHHDTRVLGKAANLDEFNAIRKSYAIKEADDLIVLAHFRRRLAAKNWGKCQFDYEIEIRAFKRVLDKMYENFDPAHDWVQEFKDSLDLEYGNKDKEEPED